MNTEQKVGTHHKPKPQEERKPLEWEPATAFEASNVEVIISRAARSDGKMLYSLTLLKQPLHDNQKPSRYFRPQDIDALLAVLESAKKWLENPTI